jgi:hypothetical protein
MREALRPTRHLMVATRAILMARNALLSHQYKRRVRLWSNSKRTKRQISIRLLMPRKLSLKWTKTMKARVVALMTMKLLIVKRKRRSQVKKKRLRLQFRIRDRKPLVKNNRKSLRNK